MRLFVAQSEMKAVRKEMGVNRLAEFERKRE